MTTSEAGLQAQIVRAVRREYPDAWVFHPVGSPYQTSGVPDLLLSVEGLFVGMEIKFIRPGETKEHALSRTTVGQRFQIMKINLSGGIAGVVTSKEEALDLIARAFVKHSQREKESTR